MLSLTYLLKNYFNPMAYIVESDLENFILHDIDPSFSTWITSVIAMVEDYIDKYCGTDFTNATSEDRYFDGSGSRELYVGPLQSVSSLQILDVNGNVEITLTATTDYHLYPLNETIKERIVLAQGGQYQAFPARIRAVKVTGVFGYDAAPEPVKLAAIQLAAKIINEGLRGGQVSAETLGSYHIDYREVEEATESLGIKEILNQYRVLSLGEI